MNEGFGKPKGLIIVIGGAGGVGSSTIANALGKKLSLRVISGGQIMRGFARKLGFSSLEDMLSSLGTSDEIRKLDYAIDDELFKQAGEGNVIVDSHLFGALSFKKKFSCTFKVWLKCSDEVRQKRLQMRSGGKFETLELSKQREKLDALRFKSIYDIDYFSPELYNDLVLDTSDIGVEETVNLILKRVKDMDDINKPDIGVEETSKIVPTQEVESPEDLNERWMRWKCLVCGFVYEGRVELKKCPKCGNEDPDKLVDVE